MLKSFVYGQFDKILLLIEFRRIQDFIFCRYGW